MADSSYNFNNVVQNSGEYLKRDYTAAAAGREAMEQRELERAEEAVKAETGIFGSITLGEKLEELGIGSRVLQQIGDTAANAVLEVARPLTKWLDEYEDVITGKIQNEFNGDAFQLYSASQLMSKAASDTTTILGLQRFDENGNPIANRIAQNFVMDM